MVGNWIFFVIGVFMVLLGILMNHVTKDEKDIYSKFFPSFLWIFAILATIFLSFNYTYAIISIYIFSMILVWNYWDIFLEKIKTKH